MTLSVGGVGETLVHDMKVSTRIPFLCPLALLVPDSRSSIFILQWIAAGLTKPSHLVGLVETSS